MLQQLISKFKESASPKLHTAETAWTKAKYSKNSIEEVQKSELQAITTLIDNAIYHGQTNLYYILAEGIDYTSITDTLINKGYDVVLYEKPHNFIIISWNGPSKSN